MRTWPLLLVLQGVVCMKNVFVSSPFDNFRIECTKKSGSNSVGIRMVESVGAKRQDIVFEMTCESVSELYPWVNIPQGIVEMEREDCRYSAMFDPIIDEHSEFSCAPREYLAGITRISETKIQIMCCKLRTRDEFNCKEQVFNKPLGPTRSTIIENENMLINAISVKDMQYRVRFCDLAPRSIENIYNDVPTPRTTTPATTTRATTTIPHLSNEIVAEAPVARQLRPQPSLNSILTKETVKVTKKPFTSTTQETTQEPTTTKRPTTTRRTTLRTTRTRPTTTPRSTTVSTTTRRTTTESTTVTTPQPDETEISEASASASEESLEKEEGLTPMQNTPDSTERTSIEQTTEAPLAPAPRTSHRESVQVAAAESSNEKQMSEETSEERPRAQGIASVPVNGKVPMPPMISEILKKIESASSEQHAQDIFKQSVAKLLGDSNASVSSSSEGAMPVPHPARMMPSATETPELSSSEVEEIAVDLSKLSFPDTEFPQPASDELPETIKMSKFDLPLKNGAQKGPDYVMLRSIKRGGQRRAPIRTHRPHVVVWTSEEIDGDQTITHFDELANTPDEQKQAVHKVRKVVKVKKDKTTTPPPEEAETDLNSSTESTEVQKETPKTPIRKKVKKVVRRVMRRPTTTEAPSESTSSESATSSSSRAASSEESDIEQEYDHTTTKAPRSDIISRSGKKERKQNHEVFSKVDNARNIDEETILSPFESEEQKPGSTEFFGGLTKMNSNSPDSSTQAENESNERKTDFDLGFQEHMDIEEAVMRLTSQSRRSEIRRAPVRSERPAMRIMADKNDEAEENDIDFPTKSTEKNSVDMPDIGVPPNKQITHRKIYDGVKTYTGMPSTPSPAGSSAETTTQVQEKIEKKKESIEDITGNMDKAKHSEPDYPIPLPASTTTEHAESTSANNSAPQSTMEQSIPEGWIEKREMSENQIEETEATMPPVVVTRRPQTTTSAYDPSVFYHTPRPHRPIRKEKFLTFCTKDVALRDQKNMVIACGDEDTEWTPTRCPDGSSCFLTQDATYRICCAVSRG